MTLGEVCTAYDCGSLNEEEAKRVIADSFDRSNATWDRWQKIGLALVAFAGLGLGILNRWRPVA
ncbi:hypothetical protein RA29_06060 [Tateyamaria sp. ANG-S1]|nr:hypothetical protein RA29_06060 [Tateyamaria sp. ANG-S1]